MNRYQENILKYANVLTNVKDIANILKVDEMKVKSTLITLARKNFINKDKVKLLLNDDKMSKLLDTPFKSGLAKPMDFKDHRYESKAL